MEFIISGLSFFLIGLVVEGIISLQKTSKQKNERIVYLPNFVLIIGIICTIVFIIPTIILLFSNENIFLIILFSAFSLLGASLIIAFMNCKISYSDSYFEVKSYFGVRRKYTYNCITSIANEKGNTTLYLGKRKVIIDEMAIGKQDFLKYIKMQYRIQNNGNSIPIAKLKSDLFNGNIKNPGEFIFVYALIGALLLAVTVFMIVVALTPNEYECKVVAFTHYDFDRNSLYLYSDNDASYYNISEYKKLLKDRDDFFSLCDRGESFIVKYEVLDGRYDIRSIKDYNEKIYVFEEDMDEYELKNAVSVCSIFVILFILLGIIVIVSVNVGRHPEKYSKQFISLFFKPSYINNPK